MIKQLIIWLVTAAAVYGEDARTLYTANCMACHALDKKIAGPSILEIAHFYSDVCYFYVIFSIEVLSM